MLSMTATTTDEKNAVSVHDGTLNLHHDRQRTVREDVMREHIATAKAPNRGVARCKCMRNAGLTGRPLVGPRPKPRGTAWMEHPAHVSVVRTILPRCLSQGCSMSTCAWRAFAKAKI